MSDGATTPTRVGTPRTRPNLVQYAGYCYGRRLPASMQEWVRHDLVDKGCATRMVLRWTVPCVVILAPLLLIPTTLYVHAGMTVPILIPFVYFAMALNRTWRRHRLAQHGLDPTLADARLRAREADQRLAYERRYGGR